MTWLNPFHRPNEGPWGQLENATKLEAGAVLKRGLVDIETLEGETVRLSIEVCISIQLPSPCS